MFACCSWRARPHAIATALPLVLAVSVVADPPPGYYASAQGRSGADLRTTLHQIVRAHTVIPYSSGSLFDTSDALKVLDRNPANASQVLLIYTPGVTVPASTFGNSSGWNREHLWPNSLGIDDVEPAYADLHNLRACDLTVNAERANKYFDASNPGDPGYWQPAHAEAPQCSTDTDSWEPPTSQKGDIARALLYMTIRYTGDVAGEPRLLLTDETNRISSTVSLMGRFTTLLKWHFADPVDTAESNRNDQVCWLYQSNRNPFVDHPEYAAAAFIPPLQVQPSGTNLLLRWLADYAPTLRLEQTAQLNSSWMPVTNVPLLTSNRWTVTLPLATGARFFRLQLQ